MKDLLCFRTNSEPHARNKNFFITLFRKITNQSKNVSCSLLVLTQKCYQCYSRAQSEVQHHNCEYGI